MSFESMLMRWRMRRRSVSSLVSPGPRVPMPPPSRDSAVADPTSRGIRYFSCASSTCSLPSRVRARRAKMSRMSCVRSTTLRSSALFEVAQLRRRQLVVEDDDVDVELVAGGRERCDLAAAEKGRGIRLRALLQHAQHDRRAGRRREAGKFVERMFGIEVTGSAVEEPDQRRTLLPIRRGRSRSRMTCHCSDFITRSHGTAPGAQQHRTVASNATIVDGAPPGAWPAIEERVDVRQGRRDGVGRGRGG